VLGALNYSQNASAQVTITSAAPQNVVSTTITTNGNPVQIICSGDANYGPSAFNGKIQLYRGGVGGTALGKSIWLESSAGNENQGFCIQVIDTPAAGTYSYYLVLLTAAPIPGSGANAWQFGEADGPVISAVELQNVRGPTGPGFSTINNWSTTRMLTAISSNAANAETNLLFANSTLTVNNNISTIGTLYVGGETNIGGGVIIGKNVASGNEGGQIDLATAPSGTLSTGTVTMDIFQDRLRIFEAGGNNRGAYLDIAKLPNSVGGEIGVRASGIVNRGVDVTLGNLKVRVASTGNISLQVATVSGTYSLYGSDVYSIGSVGGTLTQPSSPLSVTTTPAYLQPGLNFTTAGWMDTWMLMDTGNTIAWRISAIFGPSGNSTMITIERLV
jgi:hypothetical protein